MQGANLLNAQGALVLMSSTRCIKCASFAADKIVCACNVWTQKLNEVERVSNENQRKVIDNLGAVAV